MRLFVLFCSFVCTTACAPSAAEAPPPIPPGPSFEAFQKSPLESWAASVARDPSETRIAVTGRAAFVEGEPAIAFTVTNISSKPIRLRPYELPWTHTNSIDLVAMTTDGRVLRVMFPIDDPGPAQRLEMTPGHALSGTYPLSVVEKLEEHRKRSDIVVLWAYRLVLEGEEREAGVSSGVVVFGKTKD